MSVPKHADLFNPTLKALHNLGGSASIEELDEEVSKILNLTDEDLEEMMPDGTRNKFNYRMAWSRTYLKRYGLLENTSRGVWALTQKGREVKTIDKKEVQRYVQEENKKMKIETKTDEDEVSEELEWKTELLEILKTMPPDAFERLCKRLLREKNFVQVEVLGKSGDGGIDGHGVVKLGGLLSFHVYFQSKRYKDSVSSSVIRDFRGAMQGRGDKGLLITTGNFTRDARKEAQRDGAIPLDLIDGDQLVDMLKDLELGVETEKIERVIINKDWFENL